MVSRSLELIKQILGDSIVFELEHSTDLKRVSTKLLDNLHLTSLFPPLRDLLPALAASIFEPPTYRIAFIESYIAKKGLLSRVWIKSTDAEEQFRRGIKLILDLGPDTLMKMLVTTIHNCVAESKFETKLDCLMDAMFILYASAGKLDPTEPKLIPSQRLLLELTKHNKLNINVDEIIERISKTLYSVLPQRLLSYLDFMLRVLANAGLDELSSDIILRLLSSRKLEAIKVLGVIIVLYAGFVHPNRLKEQVRLNLLEFLIREYVISANCAIHGWLVSFLLAMNASRTELLNLLTLFKLAATHGGRVALRLLEALFEDPWIYLAASMLILLTALHNNDLEAISLLSISKNGIRLKFINDVLVKSGLKPRGLTAPIPWELYGHINKLLDNCRTAIINYKHMHVPPPRNLKQLNTFLKHANSVLNLELKDAMSLDELKQKLELTLETLNRGQVFASEMRRNFGVLPGFSHVINAVSSTYKKLGDRWEYTLLRNYPSLIITHREIFTLSSLDIVQKEQRPVISLIIDGLRFDDLTSRLLTRLKKRGFKLIHGGAKISLLPSITTISRRAIISGELPKSLTISKTSQKREDEILLSRFGHDIEFYYGPIATVYNRFSEREHHSDKIFVVLSELEKSMHGSSEKILAHFMDEYLHNIIELIMYLVTSTAKRHREIMILLCSDHGLGTFVRFYDLSTFLDKLTDKRLIDPSVEPLIKERFAMIPIRDSQQLSQVQQIYNSEEEFRSSFWLLRADSLGFKEVEFILKGTKTLTRVHPSSSVAVIFPRGDRKLIKGRGAIYHGGISPDETFSAYALLAYET